MRIGFIGLGVMGQPMAENLLRAGHDLAVWARRQEAAAALIARGARDYATPAALAREVDVVFLAVTASADVEQLVLGVDGLAAGATPGTVIVDHSTIAPPLAKRIARELAAQGIGFLDAPVSGGGKAARDGSLAIMVGGCATVLAKVRPLLEILGRTIIHVGDSGAGQVAKACNQMVMVAAIQACAESARLASAHGLDFAAVRAAMMSGAAASRVLEVFGGKMAARDFTAGVEARLHHKDYAIFMDEAARLGAPLPVSAQVWQQLNALMARGLGRSDTAALLPVLEA